MKLVIAVVSNDDASRVQTALVGANFMVTRLPTSGGFLSVGNTTFLCGTGDDKVEEVIGIVRDFSKRRTATLPCAPTFGLDPATQFPMDVTIGGGTIFVVDVERFEKV